MSGIGDEYICAKCSSRFKKDWSDEEALKEKEDLFGDVPLAECDLICDDCFSLVMVSNPNKRVL